MSNAYRNDQIDFSRLTIKCSNYLFNNFHKFTTIQKIDIAKAVVCKAIPMNLNGGEGIFKQYVQIFRPENYTHKDLETASRAADRGV